HGEKTDWMMGYISITVFVQIIAFVFIPIIPGKDIGGFATTAIGSDIECVLDKAVLFQRIVHTAAKDSNGPTIAFKVVLVDLKAIAAFHIDACRIFDKGIVQDMAVGDVLQQETVGCIAPVFLKDVVLHAYALCVHDCHTSSIGAESIVMVFVVMREHEMQSVAQVVVR